MSDIVKEFDEARENLIINDDGCVDWNHFGERHANAALKLRDEVLRLRRELEDKNINRTTKLMKGCVVIMKASSGLAGYGNPQCVSSFCEPLGTISLYGHNQHYNDYDIEKVLEYHTLPPQEHKPQTTLEEIDHA